MAAVSINFFQLMGGAIIAGRDFQDSDGTPNPPQQDQTAGNNAPAPPQLPTMAILSDHYFKAASVAIDRLLANRFPCLPF